MVLATRTAPMLANDTTAFRAWGKAISELLDEAGCPQTADTGQVNWDTVNATSTALVSVGYEMRRFDDSMQAAAPLFFKIEYGTGNPASGPGLWLTFGSSTNGSGAITPTTINRTQFNIGSGSSLEGTLAISYEAGGLAFMGWIAAPLSSAAIIFVIERTSNPDGSYNADGYHMMLWGAAGSFPAASTREPFASPITPTSAAIYPFMGPALGYTTTLRDNKAALWPAHHHLWRPSGPSKCIMGILRQEVLPGSLVNVEHLGQQRTFMSLGTLMGSVVPSGILSPMVFALRRD